MQPRRVTDILKFYRKTGEDSRVVSHVAFDSRKVKAGTLFFALHGEKVDGHSFLEEVAKAGAVAAVVSDGYQGESFGMSLIPAADVRQALQDLARAEFNKYRGTVVAITGTVGKTMMKEFLATILAVKFSVGKTPGNANSQVGLPLTILNEVDVQEILVLEMGMSFPGEMTRLIEIAPPDIGVLTHLSLVHAENFPDIDGIARAKCEMFQSSKTKLGFFYEKTLGFDAVKALKCEKIAYGSEDLFKNLSLPFTEEHLLENLRGAVVIARYFGMSWEEIQEGVSNIKGEAHRFEKIVKGGVTYIDDAYNASPEAVRAALSHLPKPKPGGKVVAVLGTMPELGQYSEESHREVALHALPLVDHLLCLGKETEPMQEVFAGNKPAELFTEISGVKKRMKELVKEGDTVLIKGGNFLKMWTLLE